MYLKLNVGQSYFQIYINLILSWNFQNILKNHEVICTSSRYSLYVIGVCVIRLKTNWLENKFYFEAAKFVNPGKNKKATKHYELRTFRMAFLTY